MSIDTEIMEAVEQSYRLLRELDDQSLDEVLKVSRLLLEHSQALIQKIEDTRAQDAKALREARALVQQAHQFRRTRINLESPLLGRRLIEDDARDDEQS